MDFLNDNGLGRLDWRSDMGVKTSQIECFEGLIELDGLEDSTIKRLKNLVQTLKGWFVEEMGQQEMFCAPAVGIDSSFNMTFPAGVTTSLLPRSGNRLAP